MDAIFPRSLYLGLDDAAFASTEAYWVAVGAGAELPSCSAVFSAELHLAKHCRLGVPIRWALLVWLKHAGAYIVPRAIELQKSDTTSSHADW